MSNDSQKQLIKLAKKALSIISINGKNEDFVYELRDFIRQVEKEVSNECNADVY
jgi:hypothetical protein